MKVIHKLVLAGIGSLLLSTSVFAKSAGIECSSQNAANSGGDSKGALIFQGNTDDTISVFCPLTAFETVFGGPVGITITNKSAVVQNRCRIRVMDDMGNLVESTGNTTATLGPNVPEKLLIDVPASVADANNSAIIWCRVGARSIVHNFGLDGVGVAFPQMP